MNIKFTPEIEPWTILHLEDGAIIKLKSCVSDVTKREGELDIAGKPIYDLKIANAIILLFPEEPKRA